METSDLALEYLIQGFQLSCQAEGKSPRTVEWYTAFLLRFLKFLQSNSLPTILGYIDKGHIREFIRYLQTEARTPRKGTSLSEHTVQGYVRTLKSFFSWVVKEGYLESNIMVGIPVPKAPNKIMNSFSEEQIASLVAACQRENGIGYRNVVMLMLMLDTGIRVSELIAIELDDIDPSEGFVRVRSGKGNRERLVPIGSVVLKLLWKYLNQSRQQPISENISKVFLSFDGLPLSRSGVQQMLRRCGKRAGISGVRCSPHTLRHSFAKNYLLNSGDTFSLQKILGHSSLASVRTYLNLFGVDLKKQHQRFSPVDNMADTKRLYPLLRVSAKK